MRVHNEHKSGWRQFCITYFAQVSVHTRALVTSSSAHADNAVEERLQLRHLVRLHQCCVQSAHQGVDALACKQTAIKVLLC